MYCPVPGRIWHDLQHQQSLFLSLVGHRLLSVALLAEAHSYCFLESSEQSLFLPKW